MLNRVHVRDMDYGWTLEMETTLKSQRHCRDWFMEGGIDLCLTDEELDDVALGEVLCSTKGVFY